ncbi:MAG TPA: hypothetical protein VN238_05910 [Solirubrobacteraceae bacterium]|nr:hypothetical protein [Solirubrobacteraceae bacterium]
MNRGPIARLALGGHDRLDLLERFDADQGFVASLNATPLVHDDPVVVGVREDLLHARHTQRGSRSRSCRAAGEARLGEVRRKASERPISSAVQLEGALNKRRSKRIESNRPNVLAGGQLPVSHVADWGLEGRASEPMFLIHAFADLGGQVVRVVLGVGGEHPVHQAARRGRVDVLGSRDQRHVHADELLVQHRVIESVAREAIDLVDDDVADAERLDLFKHLLEDRASSAARTLGAFDVDLRDGSRQVSGLSLTRLDLGGDGVAVFVAVSPELAGARDANVDRCAAG